jgi:hypothetical protein
MKFTKEQKQTIEETKRKILNDCYKAITHYYERVEPLIYGNGHHMGQYISKLAAEYLTERLCDPSLAKDWGIGKLAEKISRGQK